MTKSSAGVVRESTKAGAVLSGQNFVPHQADPRSDAQQKHLRCSYRSGLFKGSLKTFLEDTEYVSVFLQRFKLVHWELPWKSFAQAAFIQLFFFLKGSDLMQWCCSYVTCRALAPLKLPSCPNLAGGGVPMAGTLGEPLGGLRTGSALGTASWQLGVKLGSAHSQQQLSRALCQTHFHLSSWYTVFCLREFIQTKIWFF